MDKKTEIKISKRQESNRILTQLVSEMVEKHPDLRFHQILHVIDIVVDSKEIGLVEDLFHEESIDTLDRVNKAIEKLNS